MKQNIVAKNTLITLIVLGGFLVVGSISRQMMAGPTPEEAAKTAESIRRYSEYQRRVQDAIASHEVRQREIAEARSYSPEIGRHLCDNQDGHYRGIVTSIHVVTNSANPYIAYKLTNGQVVADAIIRVCTKAEQEAAQ